MWTSASQLAAVPLTRFLSGSCQSLREGRRGRRRGAGNKHSTLDCSQVVCGWIHPVSREKSSAAAAPSRCLFGRILVRPFNSTPPPLQRLRVVLCLSLGVKLCGSASPALAEDSGWGELKRRRSSRGAGKNMDEATVDRRQVE